MHTKGPWTYSEICDFSGTIVSYIRDIDDKEIAQTRNDTGEEQEAQANARLIAAAPCLLEELEYALNILLNIPGADEHGLYSIQEAIRKAKEK